MPAIELISPAGRLVARHDAPEGTPPPGGPAGAVVCHPHPLYGGTMDNKVVFTVARRLRKRGLHVLRFNFRGAGGSEGAHDRGAGEREDAAAALDLLAGLAGGRLAVAGFSFGSWVGLRQALDDPRVVAGLAIAPPVNHYDYAPIAASALPLAVVYGSDDELVPADAVERWLATCPETTRRFRIEGATHLFHGKLGELGDATDAWLDGL